MDRKKFNKNLQQQDESSRICELEDRSLDITDSEGKKRSKNERVKKAYMDYGHH